MKTGKFFLLIPLILTLARAQEQGSPREWVDPDTGHRVIRLSDESGSASLYFHQNGYTANGDKLVITTPKGLSTINLKTRKIEPLVEGRVSHGVGTSGTIIGVSAALRPKGVRIVAAQPAEPFHGIEGWKHMATAIRPPIWDEGAADVHLMIPTEPAIEMTRRLAREEGVFTGPSGGAAVMAARRIAESEPGRIVVLIADGGAAPDVSGRGEGGVPDDAEAAEVTGFAADAADRATCPIR